MDLQQRHRRWSVHLTQVLLLQPVPLLPTKLAFSCGSPGCQRWLTVCPPLSRRSFRRPPASPTMTAHPLRRRAQESRTVSGTRVQRALTALTATVPVAETVLGPNAPAAANAVAKTAFVAVRALARTAQMVETARATGALPGAAVQGPSATRAADAAARAVTAVAAA